uniref:VirB6 n=3 Tax=Pseudomonas TaxID=286 RepID=A0A6M4NSU1_9PSED|nr:MULTISPECIES: type IV secretion system protein [Pseudomonas]AHC05758.1 TrbL/VirB6 plasmid conjugal transfer protein [Pseudomonas putida]QJR98717.1 VirB6 [Pseudomonas juntendi]QMV81846.1 VirB6 [Pseudomonas asiatica]
MATQTYTQVLTFVDGMTNAFITQNVVAVANAIAPAVNTLLAVYVMFWGYALLRGGTKEPMMDGLQRILKMVIILYVGFQFAAYNQYVVNTFSVAPLELGQSFFGASDTSTIFGSLDSILGKGFEAGKKFWDQAGILVGDPGMYMVAILVWGQTILVTAYACFLIVGAKIALAIIMAIGPLFIFSLMFQSTSDFFSRWVQQLANYALVIIMTIAANALVMTLYERASTGAAAITNTAQVSQLFPFLVTGAISLLCLVQIPSKAGGLAGGVSFNSYGAGRLAARFLTRSLRSLMPRRRPRDPNRNRDKKRPRGGQIKV